VNGGFAIVVRRIGAVTVQVPVTAAGFGAPGAPVDDTIADYESTDCSGTPLVAAESGFLPRTATASATTIYFASDAPAAMYTVQSRRRQAIGIATGCPAPVFTALPDGSCCQNLPAAGGPFVGSYQEATLVDPNTLGLVPPFHVDVTVPQ
jgi:hypothetical protein